MNDAKLLSQFSSLNQTDAMLQLRIALMMSAPTGHVLEFGVGSGNTMSVISNQMQGRDVYGFDWFEGLPEEWNRVANIVPKGTYAVDRIPDVDENVELVIGLFQDTLEEWVAEHPEDIAFLHMDADLYSSTKYVLDMLNGQIVKGTVIVFDEMLNLSSSYEYPNWRESGEWLALNKWMKEYKREVQPIMRGQYSGTVVVSNLP